MPITQTIPIDLNTRGANPVAFTHQGDTARSFVFEVYNNGEAFSLTGYTAKIAAMLPADNGYQVIAGENMATGTISDNTITATLPAEFSAKPGNGVLTIILTGSGTSIRPINVDFRIQKSADAPETIAGASDFVPVLQRYMAEDMQTYINAWLDAHPEAMQYYISGSKLVLDENGILSIQNDTDEIVEALDLDTLRAEVTDLKSDLNAALYGATVTHQETVSVGASKTFTLPNKISAGTTLTITNNASSGSITVNVVFSDDTRASISGGGLAHGASVTYTAPKDIVGIASYINATDWNFTITYGANVSGRIDTAQSELDELSKRYEEDINGIHYSKTSTGNVGRTETITFPNPISANTEIKITSNSNGQITVNGVKSDNTTSTISSGLSQGQVISVTLDYDLYGIRSYCGATNYNVTVEYGANLIATVEDLTALEPVKKGMDFFYCRNLIGEEAGVLYPVDLSSGTFVTASTNDGNNFSENIYFYTYDENQTRLGAWSLSTTMKTRTMQLGIYDDEAGKTVKYLALNKLPSGQKVQIEIGVTSTEFQEYFPNANVSAGELDDRALRERTFNATYHTGATDFATKCTQLSSLMYGDYIADVTAPKEIESFLFFTDPHLLETNREQRCYEFIAQIQKYYNSTPTSFCLCGGDWLGNSDTPESACFKMGYIDGFMHSMFNNCYMLVGNHDTNYQGKLTEESSTYTTKLSNQSIVDLWYRELGKAYYTFDGANTKFYCFDTGTENLVLTAYDNYGYEQAEWFANSLLTDNSKHIALAAHILHYSSGNIQPLTDLVLQIAEAYNTRTSITVNGTVYDFSNATGTVEFFIGGHMHEDGNFVIHNIPCVLTTWVKANTDLGATFDLVFADYDNSKLHMIRVGSGSDRVIDL